MKFENLINLSGQQFRRITGVKRSTFDKMVEIVAVADKIKLEKLRDLRLLRINTATAESGLD